MTTEKLPPPPKKFSNIITGTPLASSALAHQAVSRPVGLAVFASDAISSTAYATEEILLILALSTAGAAAFGLSLPIALAISILLIIVTISYRQTIHAYPNGGGAYVVARDNFGENAAKVAGAALLTDYILTVSVSISAGVAQITSAFPDLYPYRVWIAVTVIVIMTLINMRGVKESGVVFAIPTYFFLVTMFLMLIVGFYQYFTGTLATVTGLELHEGTQALTALLILRAFSSGCTALTGIEAISNGITAFKEPRSHNAASTLVTMSTLLIILFLGLTFLANHVSVIPTHTETVISQVGRTVFGAGSPLYYIIVAGTALILLMAANTSYADFPRLAALHAADGFLPRQLTQRGSRLVFSAGIISLAFLSSLLVIIMQATTSQLIPLYAIGVFLSFTVSQSGMVVHQWRIGRLKPGQEMQGLETVMKYDKWWWTKMVMSGFGAICTFIVMCIFAYTKFWSGAWVILIIIPLLVLLFSRIHHHYRVVAHTLSLQSVKEDRDFQTHKVQSIILVDGVHGNTVKMVNFAKSLGHPWKALHVEINAEKAQLVRERWDRVIKEPGKLEMLSSPYRELVAPIHDHILNIVKDDTDSYVHVIMGHLVMDSKWTQILHANSQRIFNNGLARLDDQVVVTIVPYQITDQIELPPYIPPHQIKSADSSHHQAEKKEASPDAKEVKEDE